MLALARYIFPGYKLLQLVEKGKNLTNVSSPITVISNITLTVVECCSPPPVRLAAHCIAAASCIGASIASPNPMTISSAVHFISELYDHC